MLRVTVWNENKHEQEYEGIRKVYPKGIHGCIAEFLEKEEDFVGDGISFCAVCDGAFFTNKTVAVIGGGLFDYEFLHKNAETLKWVYDRLADDISKKTFENILKYINQYY